jgi:hypothetical protein
MASSIKTPVWQPYGDDLSCSDPTNYGRRAFNSKNPGHNSHSVKSAAGVDRDIAHNNDFESA